MNDVPSSNFSPNFVEWIGTVLTDKRSKHDLSNEHFPRTFKTVLHTHLWVSYFFQKLDVFEPLSRSHLQVCTWQGTNSWAVSVLIIAGLRNRVKAWSLILVQFTEVRKATTKKTTDLWTRLIFIRPQGCWSPVKVHTYTGGIVPELYLHGRT